MNRTTEVRRNRREGRHGIFVNVAFFIQSLSAMFSSRAFVMWAHLKQRPECDPAQKLSLREAASTNHDSCRFFALCLPLLALGILPNAHCSCPGCFALLICAGSLRICAIVGLLGNVCFLCHPPSPHITFVFGVPAVGTWL